MRKQVRLTDMTKRERDIALAWLVAGEGTISLYKGMNKGYLQLMPRVQIYNTDLGMLEQVRDAFGGSIYKYVKPLDGHRQCYYWNSFNFAHVKVILEDILPYLPIKQKQATLLLNLVQRRLEMRGRPYTKEDWDTFPQMKALNKRGPRETPDGVIADRN